MILFIMIFWLLNRFCVWFPNSARKLLKTLMFREISPGMSKEEFEKHFSPPYNPFDQRLCLAPAGNFFKPLKEKKANIVTSHIDHFTRNGIEMKNGEFVAADFVILATGLKLQTNFPFSTIQVIFSNSKSQ